MEKILIVGVNWLGDAILSTPAFKAIKEKFPFSHLAIMSVSRVKDVFTDNPYIDEVIIFNEKAEQKSLKSKLEFIKLLRAKKFDTVFFIHRSFTRILICFLAGIKERIGYGRLKSFFILTKRIRPPLTNIHRQDYYLNLLERSGIEIKTKIPQVFVSDTIKLKTEEELEKIRENKHFVIGLNPSANWQLKRWPVDKFAQLADLLVKELKAAVVFVGVASEQSVIKEVIGLMKEKAHNFCGRTTLKELTALVKGMDLFVSNDSGPAHLSAALGVHTLVLFGPTAENVTSPRGESVKIIRKKVSCPIPCYNLSCRDNRCLKELDAKEVFNKAKSILINAQKNSNKLSQ